jgi:hypothetical protein
MSRISTVILAAMLIAMASVSALACDCLTKSASESFKIADIVFIGKAIGVERSDSSTNTTFEVRDSLKGSPVNTVVVSGLTDCDAQFYLGWTYVVYAEQIEGRMLASSCLSTRPIDAADELNVKRKGVRCRYHERSRSYGSIAVVTGACVMLSLSVGLLVGAIRKRFR